MSQSIYKVRAGATLSCTQGTATSQLQVPQSHGASVQGQNGATIADNVGNVNIMSFGMCVKKGAPPAPCIPTIVLNWINSNKDYQLRGTPALLNISIVPCVSGGIISIEQSGQRE
ncbi:MAG: DUF4280 domain-containing protein [Firmicutes bacterium]|nr:DUF4280 domain-containing protein [Bacillota bacterium]